MGDTVGVTGKIAQHLLRSRERRLAIDDPLDAPQWGDEALERLLVGEPGMRVEELQLAGVVRIREHRQHGKDAKDDRTVASRVVPAKSRALS